MESLFICCFSLLGIGKLKSVTNLDLSNNSLVEIPLEILLLNSTLTELDLSNNNLTSIPDQIIQMTKLKTLQLSGNSFSAEELKKIKSRKFTHDTSVLQIDETTTATTSAESGKTALSTAHLALLSASPSSAPVVNDSTPKP